MLIIDGVAQTVADKGEYPAMYRHFADLVRDGQSDVDVSPLQLVADAYLVGDIKRTAPFDF